MINSSIERRKILLLETEKNWGGEGGRKWVKFHFENQGPQKSRFLPFLDFEPEKTTRIFMKRPLFDDLSTNRLIFHQIEPLKPRKSVKFHEKSQNMKISILMIKASLAPLGD